ncbi:MAG: thymidine kinase [Candidatus Rokubacteria bacterium]|nr:thymidine kinase [Candidatus Rokubacteria bacterium]
MSEPSLSSPNTGWIEVIVGSMYSGKTEELIRRLRRAQIARQKVEIFKPAIDDRYSRDQIVSHSELRIPSRAIRDAKEILRYAHEAQVIGIDEGQFLGPDLVRVCERLARRGKRVIVAGLDQDYAGRPFEPMPQLLAIAEYITKALAICVVCGNPANRTYRKKKRAGRVVVGGADLYEARCRRCYELGRRVEAPEEPPPSGGPHAGGSDEASPAAAKRRRRSRRPRRRRRVLEQA